LLLCLSLITFNSFAQELNCTVKVQAQKLQTADPRVFQTLQKALTEFMNNRRWTGDTYSQNERIECSVVINITEEKSANRFIAQATVQANRPVYRSSYNSTLLNMVDQDIAFEYIEYAPFEYSESAGGNNNLSNIMAYYAYLILGMDYDSFSPRGGSPYFVKAQNIINLNQNSGEAGWKALEKNRNRYWMIENLTNTKYDAFHTAWYKYHRDGLDMMYDDSDKGRKAVMDAMNIVNGIQQENPGIMLMQQFFAAKSEELTNIFTGALASEKGNIVQLLSKMDPVNTGRYQKILKSAEANNLGGGK
jgi:hypothetical protein